MTNSMCKFVCVAVAILVAILVGYEGGKLIGLGEVLSVMLSAIIFFALAWQLPKRFCAATDKELQSVTPGEVTAASAASGVGSSAEAAAAAVPQPTALTGASATGSSVGGQPAAAVEPVVAGTTDAVAPTDAPVSAPTDAPVSTVAPAPTDAPAETTAPSPARARAHWSSGVAADSGKVGDGRGQTGLKPTAELTGEATLRDGVGAWKYEGGASAAPASSVNAGEKPATLDSPRGSAADDLKRIKGVGPKMETMLNGMGFWHFDQISAWTPAEVAWVDANLEGFKGRVSRDDWVGQARRLASGGETEFSRKVDEGDVY